MSSDSRLFKAAIALAQQAVALDQARKKAEAIAKYTEAADILLKFIKFNKNPQLNRLCEQKITEYINRARALKGLPRRKIPRKTIKRESDASSLATTPDQGRKAEAEEELTEEEQKIRESVSETVISETPDVTWDDIAGLEGAKQALREAIVLPILKPQLFKGARRPWSGILLYGPPGTGKTLLAKAAAHECESTFFVADSASITSKWLGESEKLIKELFKMARRQQPSIIFMDEIDSVATARGGKQEGGGERRIKTQLLGEMQGVRGGADQIVVVMGATNRPWDIDTAMLRRFEKKIYVHLPDPAARKAIFEIHSRGVELADGVDFEILAGASEGYSGSDIANVCREALMLPIRELDLSGQITADSEITVRPVTLDDFMDALVHIKPVVGKKDLAQFEEWTRQFGS